MIHGRLTERITCRTIVRRNERHSVSKIWSMVARIEMEIDSTKIVFYVVSAEEWDFVSFRKDSTCFICTLARHK